MIRLIVTFSILCSFFKISAQIGTLTGTGMSICNQYSFSVCPNQTITSLNYGSQGYAFTDLNMPDVPDGTYFYILKTGSNTIKGTVTVFR